MTSAQRRLPKEEIARRGDEIFARDIQPTLSADDHGKYVVIDVETGEYEIDPDQIVTSERLRNRVPDAQAWLLRVGHRATRKYLSPRILRRQ